MLGAFCHEHFSKQPPKFLIFFIPEMIYFKKKKTYRYHFKNIFTQNPIFANRTKYKKLLLQIFCRSKDVSIISLLKNGSRSLHQIDTVFSHVCVIFFFFFVSILTRCDFNSNTCSSTPKTGLSICTLLAHLTLVYNIAYV